MVMKKYYFLASLPRTGSTLLASILNQHPNIHASATSALLDLLVAQANAVQFNRGLYEITAEQEINLYLNMFDAYYKSINKEFIFDKHRAWPNLINPLKKMGNENPKMIVTLRPVPEIITSYISLIKKNPTSPNFIDELLTKKGIEINDKNRAMTIWSDYVSIPHSVIVNAIKTNKENLLFLQYDDIVNNPNKVLTDIYNFFGIESYDGYDFNNIQNNQAEKDESGWKLKDLHKIRPQLKKESASPTEVLGEALVDYFSQFNIKI